MRTRGFLALACCLLIGTCGQLRAGEAGGKERLRQALTTALTDLLKELSQTYKVTLSDKELKEAVTGSVQGSMPDYTQEEFNSLTAEQIKEMSAEWLKSLRPRYDAYFKSLADEEAKRKKDEKDQEEKKLASVNRRRWVWTPKEWKKLLKVEKKLKQVKGFTRPEVVNNEVVDKTSFSEQTFYQYETNEFMVSSNVNASFTAELVEYVSRFVKTFPKVFPMPPRGKVLSKLVVVVFDERSQYKEVVGGEIAEWSRGVFTPVMYSAGWPRFTVYSYFYDGGTTAYDDEAYEYDKDWNIIPKKKGAEKRKGASKAVTPPNFTNFPYTVIQHEATHAMLRKYIGPAGYVYRQGEWIDLFPIFLNEGCATYFQNFNLRKSTSWNRKQTARICSDTWLIRKHTEADPGTEFDLKALMAMVNGGGREGTWAPDNGGPKTAMNYATAQSFCYYLLSTRSGRDRFRKMMEKVYKGRAVLKDSEYKKLQKGWCKSIAAVLEETKGKEAESVSVHELETE